MLPPPPRSTLFPYTTLFRSFSRNGRRRIPAARTAGASARPLWGAAIRPSTWTFTSGERTAVHLKRDRKSTRLNSSHGYISYAVFCLKKKKKKKNNIHTHK